MVYLGLGRLTLSPALGPRFGMGVDLNGMTGFRSEECEGKDGVNRLPWSLCHRWDQAKRCS